MAGRPKSQKGGIYGIRRLPVAVAATAYRVLHLGARRFARFRPGNRRRASPRADPAGRGRGREDLPSGRFHPFRPEQRARHASQRPRLHHPRGDPGTRARHCDRQRPDQRPAHLGQVQRRGHRAEPDSGFERSPDRDSRRRHARRPRPLGPGRQRRRQGGRRDAAASSPGAPNSASATPIRS